MTTSEKVKDAVMDCEGIAYDGCHKTYVLMDKNQVEVMRGYGYGTADGDGSHLVTTDDMKRSEMLDLVREWYRTSCSLKFIQSIATVAEGEGNGAIDGNYFENLIPQGRYWR